MAGRRKLFSKGRVYADFCALSGEVERSMIRKNDKGIYVFMEVGFKWILSD
jgi:hypothetical protein